MDSIERRYARRVPRPPAVPTEVGTCPACHTPVIVNDEIDPDRAVRIDLPIGRTWWHADCRQAYVKSILRGDVTS